ncbi:MAG: type VI secretion protein IcmF/TssM N-terminal domain-containing protein [Gemmataceae bacterium]
MQWLKGLFGLVTLSWLPPARRRRVLLWTLHIAVVVLVVLALGWLNLRGGLDRVLRTRWLNLNLVWLPLLFLLGYALFWLVRGLYRLLGADGAAGEFDDIESAWAAARAALDEAGVGLHDVPVYLVLGKTAGELEDVFAASRLPFQVRHAPAGDAPLRVYASREVAFVSCEGASLLPAQADRLLEAAAVPPSFTPTDAGPLREYLETAELPPPAASEVAPVPTPVRPGNVLLLGEPEPAAGPRREALLTDRDRVELATRRLQHVCNLVVRDRKPYCPVNGIVLLLPLAATGSAEDASETAQVARHDLQVAREALQLDCPRFLVLGDAEQIPGFPEVVRHFPEAGPGPSWVLGQHFPLLPDVPADQVPSLIEGGVTWVGDAMLPLVIGQLWRREGEEGAADPPSAVEANIQLYEFLHGCRLHLAHLGRLASRAVHSDGAPPYLAGCYLAGTGADAQREQGFLAGVFRRALEQQNHVRWADDALADDAAYHRYTLVGYALLGVYAVAIALLLVAWW